MLDMMIGSLHGFGNKSILSQYVQVKTRFSGISFFLFVVVKVWFFISQSHTRSHTKSHTKPTRNHHPIQYIILYLNHIFYIQTHVCISKPYFVYTCRDLSFDSLLDTPSCGSAGPVPAEENMTEFVALFSSSLAVERSSCANH